MLVSQSQLNLGEKITIKGEHGGGCGYKGDEEEKHGVGVGEMGKGNVGVGVGVREMVKGNVVVGVEPMTQIWVIVLGRAHVPISRTPW